MRESKVQEINIDIGIRYIILTKAASECAGSPDDTTRFGLSFSLLGLDLKTLSCLELLSWLLTLACSCCVGIDLFG